VKALAIDQQGTIWLTGGSAPEALPPGGFQALDVLYAGDAPLLPSGVTQVNFRVPVSLPPNWIVNGQLKCYIVADYMFDSELFTIYVR
jgi:hypothetical protein